MLTVEISLTAEGNVTKGENTHITFRLTDTVTDKGIVFTAEGISDADMVIFAEAAQTIVASRFPNTVNVVRGLRHMLANKLTYSNLTV